MKNISYPTPEGTETVYETVLLTRIELLQSRLTPLRDAYAAHAGMTKLLLRMRPAFGEAWKAAKGKPIYLEITPTHLYGACFSIPYGELDFIEPPTTPMERWAFLLAVSDGLAAGLTPHTAEVCPLYLENGLNLAVENERLEVVMCPKTVEGTE